MKQQVKKEEAVSPVIGIMLMLVVTIVVAAVITGFAMDLSKDTNKTPTAIFEAQWDNDGFTLKHKGGDPIRLKDMTVSFEQMFGTNKGITYTYSGADGKLTILGQNGKDVASVGDVIVVDGISSSGFWTLTYAPTNGLIASGDFIVP
ncbi:type IV pilin N-terminal domain-containing protein [Methanocorpusculum sp.]|nr:type IV pilin N-terminal domain-containing protein [Methanocorpusculum sp.]